MPAFDPVDPRAQEGVGRGFKVERLQLAQLVQVHGHHAGPDV